MTCPAVSLSLKRPFEEDSVSPHHQQQHLHLASAVKRARRAHPAANSRSATSAYAHPAPAAAAPALAVLLAYFPGMDEKTVTGALLDCGNNIDAAIQRLTGLHLHSDDATVAAATASLARTPQDPSPQAPLPNQHNGHASHAGPSSQRPLHPQSPSASPAAADDDGAGCGAFQEEPAGPQSAEQWVEFLVSEMAKCRDMGDARVRAAGVLQHFERFVKARSKEEARSKLLDTQRENTILKKAVQIQNSKLNEKAGQDQELQQLRQIISQYQEQVHSLELQKYSLSLHLQKAAGGGTLGSSHHNPDVF
ncbi:hypothetical protein DUNSADRAFT_6976 [Dunaliella salina]|uniref:CUE domain-containing protein n=1 Tax=Dunaliella salina TaxID=3046 RepID=A0ABQ7GM63_DUNSA|nr:hypothetical protein DUNSADRAFT_6976 [Dunaliella salina]|eukprot:KAF5835697.1 hypothetical protein DUNSADRAFT_6976 [Dunaliella salina]